MLLIEFTPEKRYRDNYINSKASATDKHRPNATLHQ